MGEGPQHETKLSPLSAAFSESPRVDQEAVSPESCGMSAASKMQGNVIPPDCASAWQALQGMVLQLFSLW